MKNCSECFILTILKWNLLPAWRVAWSSPLLFKKFIFLKYQHLSRLWRAHENFGTIRSEYVSEKALPVVFKCKIRWSRGCHRMEAWISPRSTMKSVIRFIVMSVNQMGENVYRKSLINLREEDDPEIKITFALQADWEKKKKSFYSFSLSLYPPPPVWFVVIIQITQYL